jgi:preprotein translocase subunit SecD
VVQRLADPAELRFRPVLAELPALAGPSRANPGNSTVAPNDAAAKAAIASCDPTTLQQAFPDPTGIPSTKLQDEQRDVCVVLSVKKEENQQTRYFLGPAALTGRDIGGAKSRSVPGAGYAVEVALKRSGSDKINQLAAASFSKPPPQNEVAIALDGEVISTPKFQTADFGPGPLEIAGNYTRRDASDLATIIADSGRPVRFKLKKVTFT